MDTTKTYTILVKELVFHTYEVKVPADIPHENVDEYFYSMEPDQQVAALQSSDSFEIEVDDIEEIEED